MSKAVRSQGALFQQKILFENYFSRRILHIIGSRDASVSHQPVVSWSKELLGELTNVCEVHSCFVVHKIKYGKDISLPNWTFPIPDEGNKLWVWLRSRHVDPPAVSEEEACRNENERHSSNLGDSNTIHKSDLMILVTGQAVYVHTEEKEWEEFPSFLDESFLSRMRESVQQERMNTTRTKTTRTKRSEVKATTSEEETVSSRTSATTEDRNLYVSSAEKAPTVLQKVASAMASSKEGPPKTVSDDKRLFGLYSDRYSDDKRVPSARKPRGRPRKESMSPDKKKEDPKEEGSTPGSPDLTTPLHSKEDMRHAKKKRPVETASTTQKKKLFTDPTVVQEEEPEIESRPVQKRGRSAKNEARSIIDRSSVHKSGSIDRHFMKNVPTDHQTSASKESVVSSEKEKKKDAKRKQEEPHQSHLPEFMEVSGDPTSPTTEQAQGQKGRITAALTTGRKKRKVVLQDDEEEDAEANGSTKEIASPPDHSSKRRKSNGGSPITNTASSSVENRPLKEKEVEKTGPTNKRMGKKAEKEAEEEKEEAEEEEGEEAEEEEAEEAEEEEAEEAEEEEGEEAEEEEGEEAEEEEGEEAEEEEGEEAEEEEGEEGEESGEESEEEYMSEA
eukprot:CAMPEP_0113876650 /NCGR_PEP_ID=MMETSP0780_2-20120614/5609_1 /TAXON_ID=652834 /ORGANISM="Palpitomonas bilix" /LENGTH=615 /DNA_ID=CAMNT_0000862761 /DNA_START=8290 /DNA_END=10138 /DNA_ORIENTATION=+ /assembly_acc=CAM_ASM_000599